MFTKDWDVVMDEEEIKSCSRVSAAIFADDVFLTTTQPLLRGHIVHPSIILVDSKTELADLKRWADKDIATVAA